MSAPSGEPSYSSWKGWGAESGFGAVSAADRDLFRRELRDVEAHTAVNDVLEIGFGNGAFLGYCTSRGWKVTGVELLPELLSAAAGIGVPAVPADQVDELPEGAFDLVAAFDVFEHIDPDDSIAFLRSLRARVRPGGVILLRYPNADTWIGNVFQNGDPTHVNAIGSLKLDYYAQAADLDVAVYRGARRRGFGASPIHGLHRLTAGTLATVSGALRRMIYFPDLRVVLSTSNVVALLRRN